MSTQLRTLAEARSQIEDLRTKLRQREEQLSDFLAPTDSTDLGGTLTAADWQKRYANLQGDYIELAAQTRFSEMSLKEVHKELNWCLDRLSSHDKLIRILESTQRSLVGALLASDCCRSPDTQRVLQGILEED